MAGGEERETEGDERAFFKILSHPIRVRIIELLHENIELAYTDMLNILKLETGKLNFYLRGLRGLCKTTEDGTYVLTDKGKMAYDIVKRVNKVEKNPGSKLPRASFTKRFAATGIDFAFFLGMPVFLLLLIGHWIPILKQGINLIELVLYSQALLTFVIVILILMEAYNGQTLGKYVVGIRALKEDGRKLTLVESSLRNIAKLFFLPLDLAAGLFLKDNLRFSDYYTRAVVIDA